MKIIVIVGSENFIKNQDRFQVLNGGKGNYVSVNWKHHLFLQSETKMKTEVFQNIACSCFMYNSFIM